MLGNKELVVKSNRLIEAKYRLTLIEQQIILYAICRCREEQIGLSGDTLVTIHANDFAAQFGTHPEEVYRQLKSAMDTLHTRSVKFHDTADETGKPRVIESNWISNRAYIDGAGQIQIQFSAEIVPLITRLETAFTSYRLDRIGRMTSAHAVRLYELLLQYLSIRKRELEITKLKEILQLNGQYGAIKDLKKWVIDVAVGQINAHSDLLVSYTQRKTGRAVTHLLFDIKSKPKTTEITPNKDDAGGIRRTIASPAD